MRKLDRAVAQAPNCLAQYNYRVDKWSDVEIASKIEIGDRLQEIQGTLCAYCESSLDSFGKHIEHFRTRSGFPHLTFYWPNLYLSCSEGDTCGHYKDNGAGPYDVNELIDPCIDDPDLFFRFRSDGTISVRDGLADADVRRATETLRVLNLHPENGRLRNMRKAAVAGYVSFVDGCVGFTVQELHEFFEAELAATVAEPFSTAIRHVLTEL